jgi:hypothetical protein
MSVPEHIKSIASDWLVLGIAVELDLVPWSSKSKLSDDDLAPARTLCRLAGSPDVEDSHEVITLRNRLEQTEAQRGNACAWALFYKRVSEGRPEPEGVRGTPRPLSLVLDDQSLAQEPSTVSLAQWRARAIKAEATLAEIRQTSMDQVMGFTQELMATLIDMLDPEAVGEMMADKDLAWCPNCEAWVKFVLVCDQNNEVGADCASCRRSCLEDCELGSEHVLAAARHLGSAE